MTRFCLITMQRSGSTWLMDCLNRNSGIRAYMELFLTHDPAPAHDWLYADHPHLFHRHPSRRRGLSRIVSYLKYVETFDPSARTTGFKIIFGYQLLRRVPHLLLMLLFRRYTVLFLTRAPIEIVLSRAIAQATGISHATGETSEEPKAISLNPTVLVRDLRRVRRRVAALDLLARLWPGRCLHLDYDKLWREPEATLRWICDALDEPFDPLSLNTNGLTKRVAHSYPEAIANFPAVMQALSDAGEFHAYNHLSSTLQQTLEK